MTGTITRTSAGSLANVENSLYIQFVEYIDRKKTTSGTYMRNLRQFAKWLYEHDITEPERKDIIMFRDDMMTRCKPGTVAQYLRTVKAFYSWGTLEGIFPRDITANIHPPRVDNRTPKKRHLRPEEVFSIEESIIETSGEAMRTAYTSQKDTAGKLERTSEQGKRLYAMFL